MMKRSFSLLVAVVMGGNILFAQNADQGKKFYYYERYTSAKEAFEKVLSANPNNIDAVYWLGQTLLAQKDSVGAKNLYQKLLQQNGNAPLVIVGMGQIELMEGKANDARQRFEMAITSTKGKDVDVLNAVGRANVDARSGDATYAIEKLTQATQTKNFKDPETYLLMGDAYRKLIDGGNAVVSYNKAGALDDKLAAAKYKTGKVYLTQNNPDYFLPAFEEAVQVDPAYTPAIYELFYYWYFRDVNKASQYLEQYVTNSDPGPSVEYLRTDFTYAKGDFAGAKAKAQQLIDQYGANVNPRMYRMIAYTSDTLGDPAAAKQAMHTFLSKADPEDVLPADYIELAKINIKLPDGMAEAFTNYEQAVAKDTAIENKINYINQAAALAKKLGDRKQEANWLGVAYGLKPNPTQTDLYNWGMANYQAANYTVADSLFCNVYQGKYPDQIYGYLWCARTKQAMDDSVNTNGLAVEAYKLLAEKAKQIDSVKFKAQIISSYFFLVQYYNDVKNDRATAIEYVNKVLETDPANADAIRIKGILERSNSKPAAQPAKPRTTSSTAAGAGAKAAGSR